MLSHDRFYLSGLCLDLYKKTASRKNLEHLFRQIFRAAVGLIIPKVKDDKGLNMLKIMIYVMKRSSVRFCCLTRLGLVIFLMFATVINISAQIFEEIPVTIHDRQEDTSVPKRLSTNQSVGSQPLPAIVTPDDAQAQRNVGGVTPAFGDTSQNGVVLAQYQEDVTWSSSQSATLPSVRLVQGNIPKVASIEKPLPQTLPYRGPGQIIMDESDGMIPTITTRPSTFPGPPPLMNNQRSQRGSGIVNAYAQPDEAQWDNAETIQEYEPYETLPGQLGYGSAYSTQEQYGLPESGRLYGSQFGYGNIHGGIYGSEMTNEMYVANGNYGYGQNMYGYASGGYPAYYYQPSHGLVSGVFSHILCSKLWENLTVGFGGAGFKSPLDFQNGGAFGFTESLNWASPSTSRFPVRLQAGVRAFQAYPSGWDDFGTWQRHCREQYFGTVGAFRRNLHCSPLNFGVAYDVMSDNYYDKYKLEQLRSELSYGSMVGVEFGYRGAFRLRNDSFWLHNRRADVRVVDYHTLFLKKYFTNGGEGSLAGGATEYGDAMFRAEYSIPLSNEWGLKNSLSYIIPRGGHSPESPSRESWDVSLQLVYQPQGGMLAGFCNPFRTFFDVADNGTLVQRLK